MPVLALQMSHTSQWNGPFPATQQPFSATMGKVRSYFGDKNEMVNAKMQLELKIHSLIMFIGKLNHLWGFLGREC